MGIPKDGGRDSWLGALKEKEEGLPPLGVSQRVEALQGEVSVLGICQDFFLGSPIL